MRRVPGELLHLGGQVLRESILRGLLELEQYLVKMARHAIHKKMKIMLENGKASLRGNRDLFTFALRTWRFREKTYFRFC